MAFSPNGKVVTSPLDTQGKMRQKALSWDWEASGGEVSNEV
jgi:hypothetical protein